MPAKVTWKPYRATIAGVKNRLYSKLNGAGEEAKRLVAERLSPVAMSRDELARRDHPYAARKGGMPSNLPTPQSKSPKQYVGQNTGRLSRSLYGVQRGFYYLLEFKKPPSYTRFVFDGTRVMVARTPMAVLDNEKAQKGILAKFAKGGI